MPPGRPKWVNTVRIVIQRVKNASVRVDGLVTGEIGTGLLIFLGVTHSDTEEEADYLTDKTIQLRIFPDESGRMNRSLLETGGELLVVSQFTLYGDTRKGRRPGFDEAAQPEKARALYQYFVNRLKTSNLIVQTGVFQADMQVHLINDGPVTFILDSSQRSRVK